MVNKRKKRLLYTPPASDSITNYEEFVQEESIVQYKEATPYQETTVPTAKGSMTMQDVIYFFTNSRIFKYKSDSS